MAWQDVSPLTVSHIDAEEERELRLAAQARAGAEWALAALVARYQPPVTRYLTRLTGDPDIVRTLAEAIFVRMEKRLRGPQGGQRLRLWVLRACTEAGLDFLRHPYQQRAAAPQLHGPRLAGLLPERAGEGTTKKLRAGLGALASITGSTSRQVRGLIWSTPPESHRRARKPLSPHYPDRGAARGRQPRQPERSAPLAGDENPSEEDPREALRFRMVRAVLAELPYGDAQCLALHLIAGLNQAEVARALGITNSATRRRIVHGLQLFAQRYEAAAASLGISPSALTPAAPAPSPASVPSPEDEREGMAEALAAPGAPITPPENAGNAMEVDALPFSSSEPSSASTTSADTPDLAYHEPEYARPAPGADETSAVVEITAVVHDISTGEPPVVDTSAANAPDMVVDDTAATSDVASSEPEVIAADVALDTQSVLLAEAGEEERDVSEDASTDEYDSASAAPAGEPEAATPASARVVPILSVPFAHTDDDAEAPVTVSEREERAGAGAAEQEAATAPMDTPITPRPVRLIPVLTAAAAGKQGAATVEAPVAPSGPSVRTVPVLTPTGLSASPSTRLAGGDINADEAPHETLAMTAMMPEDATLDA